LSKESEDAERQVLFSACTLTFRVIILSIIP
jgi:hypothetical protein